MASSNPFSIVRILTISILVIVDCGVVVVYLILWLVISILCLEYSCTVFAKLYCCVLSLLISFLKQGCCDPNLNSLLSQNPKQHYPIYKIQIETFSESINPSHRNSFMNNKPRLTHSQIRLSRVPPIFVNFLLLLLEVKINSFNLFS